MKKTYLYIFLFLLSVNLLFTGGRIASSDETAYFLEAQSVVERGTLAIPTGIVNNGAFGVDGRFYVGGGVGYTILGAPMYAFGLLITKALPIPETYSLFVLKGIFTLINPILCALLGLLMIHYLRFMSVSWGFAFLWASALLFTTNVFVYSKSSMREPLITVCVLMAIMEIFTFGRTSLRKHLHLAGIAAGWLVLIKPSFLIFVPVFGLYLVWVLYDNRLHVKDWLRAANVVIPVSIFSAWVSVFIGMAVCYNWLIFGGPFTSGYSKIQNPFSNPFLVGVYGLLFSSGKSLFLYAPLTILIFPAARCFLQREFKLFTAITVVCCTFIALHAKFVAWAGDGSWGPRYLLPIVPLLFIVIGTYAYETIKKNRTLRFMIQTLAVIGLLIQFGGMTIYLGSYYRYLGEYPYTREFSDPEFLYKSHFVPNYSPVVGHWELMGKAISKHWNGDIGVLSIRATDERIPLSDEDRSKVTYLIDYWFMYLYYAGVSKILILLSVIVMVGFVIVAGWNVRRQLQKVEIQ
ncbi:MAG TPA: hypothetical protein PLG25_01355 [bacterium]|nr:hypothetical protein [bacterium]